MTEPRWLVEARKSIGVRETPGRKHTTAILRMWVQIKSAFSDDETPWCAGFVGSALDAVGIRSTRSASARSYLQWGVWLEAPVPGCLVVFWRGALDGDSGHVAFVVGQDVNKRLLCLGGNQGDAVSIAPFDRKRVLGYRWPADEPLNRNSLLPVIVAGGQSSENEA